MKLFNRKKQNKENNNFENSSKYWKDRYKKGGNSGAGSYNELAEFKANVINEFITEKKIKTIIDFGCGDGNQIEKLKVHNYVGYDISEEAITICNSKFKNDKRKAFRTLDEYIDEKAELTISLDVLFHLVEDNVFNEYMFRLFRASNKYVIIYSSNFNKQTAPHVKHRKFTDWIEKNITEFNLTKIIKNKFPYNGDVTTGSYSDFYIYVRK